MTSQSELSNATKVFAVIWLVLGVIVFIAGYGVYQAWVIQKIWLWYMTAKFGEPAVTLSECYVILMAFRMLLPTSSGDEWKKDLWSKMTANAIVWAVLLGVARWLR